MRGHRAYPKEISIRGEIWTVRFYDYMFEIDKNGKRHELLGECCPDKKLIRISKAQQKGEMLKTFFHELQHAFENEYEFKITNHTTLDKIGIANADFILQNFNYLLKIFSLDCRCAD